MTGYDWGAIKINNPIEEVVGSVVKLVRKGNEYSGCCPFHAEKSPSFTVVPAKGFWHCFGCGKSGDVIDFIAFHQGISTEQAVATLSGGNPLKMSDEDRAEHRRIMEEREAAQARDRAAAIKRARQRWDSAGPAPASHGYLTRKNIEAHCARIEGANLLLPIYGPDDEIQSVQTIAPDGAKLFQRGAPTKSGRMMIGIHLGRTIICEGFATGVSINDAVPDQVCVAYSKNNVHVIARELAAQGVSIVIASDTNAAAEMTKLAAELGCPVVVPDHGGNPAIKDFNDQAAAHDSDHVAGTFAQALRAYAKAKSQADADAAAEAAPVDLWAQYQPPILPTGILPDVLERFARVRGEQMGVDPGGIAMSALTVCASVIRDSIKIKVKQHEGWTESARIWTMLIGDPSYKKSPIMRAAAGKIKSMDAQMLADGNRALADWNENGGAKGGQPMPLCPRLRVEDITMEAAQEVCRHSPDGILVLQDELSGWFGGIEKYSGGKGGAKDRSFWLTAFGGGQYAVNRVGRGSYLIDNLSVTILGGVQPDPIRRIVAEATDDGLIQRFFPIILQPACVGRDEETMDVSFEYDALIERLHDLQAPDSVIGSLPLQFDDGARRIREELEARHHKLVVSTEGFNKKLAAHIGKFDGLFARLCIIWHCIEHLASIDDGRTPAGDPLPVMVSEDIAARVSKFLSHYIMRHSLAFYAGVIGLTEDQEQLCDVAGYILAHRLDEVTMRTLQRGNRRTMRKLTRDEGQRLFEQLEAMGWLDAASKRGESPVWAVRPEVHAMYEAKAEAERQRRVDMRRAIRDMAGDDED